MQRLTACLPPGMGAVRAAVRGHAARCRVGGLGPSANIRNYHLLYSGLKKAARTMDLDLLFEAARESEVQIFVAEHARERIFVHAGVVGWKGRAILLPGRSHAGNIMLVARRGEGRSVTYYSDEYAVLDSNGYVHPYARPADLRRQPAGPPRCCPAHGVGCPVVGSSPAAGRCRRFLARYQPGASWRPQNLTPGAGAVEVLDPHGCRPYRRPEQAVTVLQQIVPRSRNVKGLRGERAEGGRGPARFAEEPSGRCRKPLAPVLRGEGSGVRGADLQRARPPHPRPLSPEYLVARGANGTPTQDGGTRTQLPAARQAGLVVRELPGETLVYDLENNKAHCLNGTAALVWRRCDGQTTVAELAQTLHEELGLPADEVPCAAGAGAAVARAACWSNGCHRPGRRIAPLAPRRPAQAGLRWGPSPSS